MKIVQLTSENIKCLKAVSITPDGNLVVIGGRNGQGKSSVLDSIEWLLRGKTALPSRPIREGQDQAKGMLDLDDIVVERTTSHGRDQLIIKNKDGTRYAGGSPQAMLDKLWGKLAFDPLAFMLMVPKDQVALLKRLTNLDFDKVDAERSELYEKRAVVNRQKKDTEGQLAGMADIDSSIKEVSLEDLIQQHRKACDKKAEKDQAVALLQATKRDNEILSQDLRGLARVNLEAEQQYKIDLAEVEEDRKKEYESFNEASVSKNKELELGKAAIETISKSIDAIADPDIDSILAEMQQVEDANKKARAAQDKIRLEESCKSLAEIATKLTDDMDEIDLNKKVALQQTKLPVDGLAFNAERVTLDGLPLDQRSSAEKLRTSIAIGLADNPKLRLMLVRNGSVLDKDGLVLMGKMAEEADAQILLERVGEGEECQVVIEDGMVKQPVAV